MRLFEIFVAPEPRAAARAATPPSASAPPRSSAPEAARRVVELFAPGVAVAARISERHGVPLVRDLAVALVELLRSARGKGIVRFYDEPWEVCIERLGPDASVSVYRSGADPVVAVYDRRIPLEHVVAGVRNAAREILAAADVPASVDVELRAALDALASAQPSREFGDPIAPVTVVVEADQGAPIAFSAEFAFRPAAITEGELRAERADLHALLFRGRIRADIRGRRVELGEAHPYLFAERLVDLARRTLDAWGTGQKHLVRADAGGIGIGVRVGSDGALALTLLARPGAERATCTFPALHVPDLVEAALGFARALVRAVLRRDRSQADNLRLSGFRRQIREASDALREVCKDDTKINPEPEPYRTFAGLRRSGIASAASCRAATGDAVAVRGRTRLQYTSRWRALVPGIDLRSTFLCGDRFLIGGTAETFCLDRTTGQVLWRIETERATSVVTPGGLARLHPDGTLCLHDYGTGEVTVRAWLAPRQGGPPAGAVVQAPRLPRMLILTEGERHLVAVDLASGEPRWRCAWGRRGTVRLKRAGKLLYVTSGDSALSAIDVLSGTVVWRLRDRLRFHAAPTVDHDALFAVGGGAGGAATLHAIDPYSGATRWVRPLESGAAGCSVDGSPLTTAAVVVCVLRDRRGLRLVAFDADSGERAWASNGFVAPPGTAWLAVDDLLLGNTPTGELVAVEVRTGATRYRHVLGRTLEVDVPRRLEPILRSGALFVPHNDVHVFRPSDGSRLAVIGPCDAIPDLLRVDERCDVYVAEESGHVASFVVGARLSLVSG